MNWYRVYASDGKRLLVRGVDLDDAMRRAEVRWWVRGKLTSKAIEVRPATIQDLHRRTVSMAALRMSSVIEVQEDTDRQGSTEG